MQEEHDNRLEIGVSKFSPEALSLMQLLYEEGWRQYTHEDNLGQRRTTFFLGLQGGVIAFFGAISPRFYEVGWQNILGYSLDFGLVLLGFLWLIAASFCLIVIHNWHSVTIAGRQYVEFRRIHLQCIEELLGIQEIGLATKEFEWRATKTDFIPFPCVDSMKRLSVKPLRDTGWLTMEGGIRSMGLMWLLVMLAAVAAVLLGVFPVRG